MLRHGMLILICLIASLPCMADTTGPKVLAVSPDDLIYDAKPGPGGKLLISNLDTRAGEIKVDVKDIKNPIVFELGKPGNFLRRVYPEIKNGILTLNTAPFAKHEIVGSTSFSDSVLSGMCGINVSRLTVSQKLDMLAAKLRQIQSIDEASLRQRRLLSQAYQALLGFDFMCLMKYESADPAADYKIFAGRSFPITCIANNHGSEALKDIEFTVFPPDEWQLQPVKESPPQKLCPGKSLTAAFQVSAPYRSTDRPNPFPVVAQLTCLHKGTPLTLHYPLNVQISDPFIGSAKITSATSNRINTTIHLTSSYPGLAMNDISVYTWLLQGIKTEPVEQKLSFSGKGSFPVTFVKDGKPDFQLRASYLMMKVDDTHIVRLRTVMETVLNLGSGVEAPGFWLKDLDDGKTERVEVGGRGCRQTVPNRFGDLRYMYFMTSINFPASGNSYVTVTYFDGPKGSFSLEYDSAESTYKACPDVVTLQGTDEWKQKTFVLQDASFTKRQNGKSDFRLVISGADLAVSQVAASKFSF